MHPGATRSVFAGRATTIFTVMSALAEEYHAVNLGQGFPDEDGPYAIREAAARALITGPNQYPFTRGLETLRQAIAAHARRFYGLAFDPEHEVLVTSGGTEALAASIMALAGPGDEVVLIEPAYDSYRPIAEAVGATVKTVTLQPPLWRLTETALDAALSAKTAAIFVNTPLNPIGRVFDTEEMEILSTAIANTRAVAICDEVYEHLVFDGREFEPLLKRAGMAGRAVRIGSAGKMFSLTGWKIGWVTGARPLVDVIAKAHQFLTFTTPPALQTGIAHGLAHEMQFTLDLTRELESKRNLLAAGLADLGFEVLPCEGTYFLTAGIGNLTSEPDVVFCERLAREAGVALIPLSVFFGGGKPDHLVRLAFCKKRPVIDEALCRLKNYFASNKS